MNRTYVITDAAKILGLESHVLRYWERELGLDIPRSSQGYRYYTREHLQLFQCIQKLKEQGLTLKELKPFIPRLLKAKSESSDQSKDISHKNTLVEFPKSTQLQTQLTQLEELRTYIGQVLQDVVTDNNSTLTDELSSTLLPEIKTEIKFLSQAMERQEEDHYRRLDRLIRQHQQANTKHDLSYLLQHGKQVILEHI